MVTGHDELYSTQEFPAGSLAVNGHAYYLGHSKSVSKIEAECSFLYLQSGWSESIFKKALAVACTKFFCKSGVCARYLYM